MRLLHFHRSLVARSHTLSARNNAIIPNQIKGVSNRKLFSIARRVMADTLEHASIRAPA